MTARTHKTWSTFAGAALLLFGLLAPGYAQTITSYEPLSIPQKNPGTNTQPPPFRINILGTGFLTTTTATFTWAGGSGSGTVHFASSTSVVVTLPTTIPSSVTSITPTLCNGASCATGAAISLFALGTSTGTLTATPNPTGVQQSVVLASTFQPVEPFAGAASGTVTFTSGTTTLGTSKLILDPGDSSFVPSNVANLSQQPATQIYTADFNGDGIPDVLFFDNNSQLHVVLGTTPFGSFQNEIVFAPPTACLFINNVATADVNNDGFSDIVIDCGDNGGNTYAYALLSNGDGTFTTSPVVSNVYGGQIALADMNHDGKIDLVIAGLLTPQNTCFSMGTCVWGFAVYDGIGDGTFAAPIQVPTTIQNYSNILLADIDHDGYPDIIGLNDAEDGNSTIDIYLNHAGTSYGVPASPVFNPSYSIALQPYPYFYTFLFTADFNGDGLPDLGVGYQLSGGTTTYGVNTTLNTSTAGSVSFGALNSVGVSGFIQSIVAADLNGDGFPDIIVDNGDSGQFFENDGNGNFANTYPKLSIPANSAFFMTAVDLNADGDADLLVIGAGSSAPTPVYSLTSYVTSGRADANLTFTPAQDGQPVLTATWPGNIDITGSSANFTLTVNGAATATSISSTHASTEYGESDTLTSTVTSEQEGIPSGTITFLDGTATLAIVNLVNATASYSTSALKVGKHIISAIYSGDTIYAGSTSGNSIVSVNVAQPVISWTPSPATITYGTALGASQLDATAASTYVTGIPGTFHYTPASGTVLTVGTQTLNVSFTPTDTVDFATATGSTSIVVGQATPIVNWSPPAAIVVGTPLSSTQLDATATGPLGVVAGTFTYTPPTATVLAAGASQPLNVQFAPTDTTDYAPATGSTTITVIPLAITSLSPSSVTIGSTATLVTLAGTGFLPNSVISINGTAAPTTYISATSLSTTIPATSLLTVQTLSLTVTDPTQAKTSAPASFNVTAPAPAAVFTGPSTTTPGEQPILNFSLTSDYPIPITGTLTLTFAGIGGVDDPSIQFSSGGRTLTFTIPANSTTAPAIQLQSGTDAGIITVTLVLTAGGQNITPASILPIQITIPSTVPTVTSMTLATTGNTITASIMGYSDTRDLSQATFHFTGASGASINTPDITIPATTLFTTWYSGETSQQYGSSFLYTQEFNLTGDPSTIASITVTLTNSVGTSTSLTAQ
jgi:hypothetical protein